MRPPRVFLARSVVPPVRFRVFFADTIAATATGAAPAPRALVRVSGPHVSDVVARLLTGVPAARFVGAARLRLAPAPPAPRESALPVLVLRCMAPASYTGEDTLELLLPGGSPLVQRVMERVLDTPGVRPAEPGEFSARAYHHARLSLAQAEGVAALIASASAAQAQAARDLLSGARGTLYRTWIDRAAHLLARVEAGIDFSDQEDVVSIEPSELHALAVALADEVDPAQALSTPSEQGAVRPRVVLAGPPSAGKSTLFNTLLGRPRALVHPAPGTTRDALVEALTLSEDARGPITIDLVDLAGLDDVAPASLDAAVQRAARAEMDRASLVVWCQRADAPARTAPPLPSPGPILVLTQCDRLQVRGESHAAEAGHVGEVARVCALDGRGIASLRRVLYDRAWAARPAPESVLPRHREARARAASALREAAALAMSRGRLPAELVADLVRTALDALGELAGRVERDEVIGRIFAAFCIGK